MTTIKTSELTGAALNYCVEWAITGLTPDYSDDGEVHCPDYDANWEHGGPIAQKLIMDFGFQVTPDFGTVVKFSNYNMDECPVEPNRWDRGEITETGITLLDAACRTYVALSMGDEVDVPEELV